MLRPLRLVSLGLLSVCLLTSGRAQTRDVASLPLPETLFPDLKGILESALKQSPRMIARNAENSVAEQNRIAARAGMLPSAYANMQYNPYQRDDRVDQPAPTVGNKLYYNINVTQPLFHWGALRNTSRIGELQEKIAKGQTAEAYRVLVQEIRGQYLSVVLRKMIQARAQLALGLSRDQLALAQSKFEKKVISEGEMFSPRLNHDQAVLAADRATEDYENAKTAFAKLTGAPRLNDSQVPSETPSVTAAPEGLQSYLTDYSAQKEPKSYYLDILRQQVEVEQLNYKVASTRLKPKVNMMVGMSQDEQSYTSNLAAKYGVLSTFVGVSLSWSIFDGFAARSAVANALTRRRQAEQAYQDASVNLTDQVRNQYTQLGFAARSMEMSNRVLGSSEGYVHSKEDDVKRGLASEAEVSAARLNYFDSQINACNTRFDYLMKTGDFLSMMLQDPALDNLSGRNP